ncbi:MAG TPA: hypothetical protein VN719_09635 [Gemmatimonadales bacterium]|nr:hypothetical protein [Gemmatimonadales bacterium]
MLVTTNPTWPFLYTPPPGGPYRFQLEVKDSAGGDVFTPQVPLAGFTPPPGSLQEAIQAFFATRPDLQAMTSDRRLWHLEADEGTELPYVEYFKVAEPTDVFTTGGRVLKASFQINCYHWTVTQAIAVRQAFQTAFDGAPLNILGQVVAYCIPNEPLESKAEGKGPKGEDCYASLITFDVLYAGSL